MDNHMDTVSEEGITGSSLSRKSDRSSKGKKPLRYADVENDGLDDSEPPPKKNASNASRVHQKTVESSKRISLSYLVDILNPDDDTSNKKTYTELKNAAYSDGIMDTEYNSDAILQKNTPQFQHEFFNDVNTKLQDSSKLETWEGLTDQNIAIPPEQVIAIPPEQVIAIPPKQKTDTILRDETNLMMPEIKKKELLSPKTTEVITDDPEISPTTTQSSTVERKQKKKSSSKTCKCKEVENLRAVNKQISDENTVLKKKIRSLEDVILQRLSQKNSTENLRCATTAVSLYEEKMETFLRKMEENLTSKIECTKNSMESKQNQTEYNNVKIGSKETIVVRPGKDDQEVEIHLETGGFLTARKHMMLPQIVNNITNAYWPNKSDRLKILLKTNKLHKDKETRIIGEEEIVDIAYVSLMLFDKKSPPQTLYSNIQFMERKNDVRKLIGEHLSTERGNTARTKATPRTPNNE